MAGHKTYEESIKSVYRGLILLAVVTLVEVAVSLAGKGHIFHISESAKWIVWIAGLIIIVLSIYKAYFIIYEFMHMGYEVPGLRMSVLLPVALLIWGMIAFFQEGGSWNQRRELIKEKNEKEVKETYKLQGMIYIPDDTKNLM